MLGDISNAQGIYIVCGYTDMRRYINGLASLVQSSLGLDPFSRKLFLFRGKHVDRMKDLLWEDDGFILLYKRLENGKFKWPRTEEQVRNITWQEFRWFTEGLSIDQPKAIKKADKGNICRNKNRWKP